MFGLDRSPAAEDVLDGVLQHQGAGILGELNRLAFGQTRMLCSHGLANFTGCDRLRSSVFAKLFRLVSSARPPRRASGRNRSFFFGSFTGSFLVASVGIRCRGLRH